MEDVVFLKQRKNSCETGAGGTGVMNPADNRRMSRPPLSGNEDDEEATGRTLPNRTMGGTVRATGFFFFWVGL